MEGGVCMVTNEKEGPMGIRKMTEGKKLREMHWRQFIFGTKTSQRLGHKKQLQYIRLWVIPTPRLSANHMHMQNLLLTIEGSSLPARLILLINELNEIN
jgi:hypothetical protein